MNLEYLRQIVEECSNIEIHKNPFSGGPGVPCGLTDGQTGDKRFGLVHVGQRKLKGKTKVDKEWKTERSRHPNLWKFCLMVQ
jgi:hypothetical protein